MSIYVPTIVKELGGRLEIFPVISIRAVMIDSGTETLPAGKELELVIAGDFNWATQSAAGRYEGRSFKISARGFHARYGWVANEVCAAGIPQRFSKRSGGVRIMP